MSIGKIHSTVIESFYQGNFQAIDEGISGNSADSYKDQIILLLFFLDRFSDLLSEEIEGCNKNSTEYCKNFVRKYIKGRSIPLKESLHKTVKIGETIPDQMVRLILLQYENNDEQIVQKYIEGHILAMSAENLLGNLLEEYIANEIEGQGWIWCPGQIILATDFLKMKPNNKWTCLQIKNADNSENSSSKKIRDIFGAKGDQYYKDNIEIKSWFRSVSKLKLTVLKTKIYQSLSIESSVDSIKNKVFEVQLGSSNFSDIKTLRKIASLFELELPETSARKLKESIHSQLDIKDGNKLNILKTKIIQQCLNGFSNFNKSETWIEIAKLFGLNNLIEKPERDTKWKDLNELLDLPEGHLSEDKFKQYILELYKAKG